MLEVLTPTADAAASFTELNSLIILPVRVRVHLSNQSRRTYSSWLSTSVIASLLHHVWMLAITNLLLYMTNQVHQNLRSGSSELAIRNSFPACWWTSVTWILENPKMPLWYDHKLGICRLSSRFNTSYIVKRRIANYIAFTRYGSILSIFPCCYNFSTVQGQISCLVHGKCTGSTNNGATGGKWSSSRSVGK